MLVYVTLFASKGNYKPSTNVFTHSSPTFRASLQPSIYGAGNINSIRVRDFASKESLYKSKAKLNGVGFYVGLHTLLVYCHLFILL